MNTKERLGVPSFSLNAVKLYILVKCMFNRSLVTKCTLIGHLLCAFSERNQCFPHHSSAERGAAGWGPKIPSEGVQECWKPSSLSVVTGPLSKHP